MGRKPASRWGRVVVVAAASLAVAPLLASNGARAAAPAVTGSTNPQPQCSGTVPTTFTHTVTPPVPPPPTTAPTGTARLLDFTFDSTAVDSYLSATYGRAPHVDILEPDDYTAAAAASGVKWPVIYLLHGHGGSYSDWSNPGTGNVEAIIDDHAQADVARRPVHAFVVMPDGGYDGFYSDWIGLDADGHNGDPSSAVPPQWQEFHINEIMNWVEDSFPVRKDPAGTAIAGLSMGGFGAMSYPALYPNTFGYAGEFSGAVDSDVDWPVGSAIEGEAVNLPDRKAPDNCIWGDPVIAHQQWLAHDPTALAAHLQGIHLFLASGNGAPDPNPNAPAWNAGAAGIEQGVYQENMGFLHALQGAGVNPEVVDFYPYGTHEWYYWQIDLAKFLAMLQSPADRFPSP